MPVAANAARVGPAPSAAAWGWCRSAGACARPGLRPAASRALAAPVHPGSLEDLRLRCERLRAAVRRSMEYLRLRLRYERLRAAVRRSWQGAPLQRLAQHRGRPEQGRQSLQQRLRLRASAVMAIGSEMRPLHGLQY